MMGWRDVLLCELARAALAVAPSVVVPAAGTAIVAAAIGARRARALPRPPTRQGVASPGPRCVAAALLALTVYLGARALDPLLASRLVRPSEIDPERWARIGFFEWRLLGSPLLAPILPLADHWALGVALHAVGWGCFVLLAQRVIGAIASRTVPGGLSWMTSERDLPFYYRWVGASTARRADHRFRQAAARILAVAALLHLAAGALVVASGRDTAVLACEERAAAALVQLLVPGADASAAPQNLPAPSGSAMPRPSPGAWTLATILLAALAFHLVAEGRAPEVRSQPQEETQQFSPAAPPPSALQRLAAALGDPELAHRVPRERQSARPEERVPIAEDASVVTRDLVRALTGSEGLWSHQRQVLEHLAACWKASAARARGQAPQLKEEALTPPFSRADEIEHPLVLAPEGAGRSTLVLIAALQIALDRGATSLVVTPDRDAARATVERARSAILRSSARWHVPVAAAGDDLASMLLARRVPAIVVADLESFESEVLSDPRTDPIFRRLGLIAIDDLDEWLGVPEMHLHMAMKRVWTLLDSLHDAPYPPLLLAVAGPSASGLSAWARKLLAAPLRVFDRDGAPRPARAIVRRCDMRVEGREPTIAELAAACARAEIPWHLRLAGDAGRRISRAAIDFPHLPRHAPDPLDAEVVLIEGRWPDVRRESERVAPAGLRVARDREILVVLAAPAEDNIVLDEEAEDGTLRALAGSLPRAVALSEPEVVRQRHFDRALGRETDVDALRARFGGAFVDETLARLEARGRVTRRIVLQLDPRTDSARPTAKVRTAHEAAIGEPIAAGCVGVSSTRVTVVDEATGATLCEVDGAIAIALHPPGSLLLHRSGRYVVRDGGGDARTLLAAHGQPPGRTTPDREVAIAPAGRTEWEERSLGGEPLRVALARVEIVETFHGVRRWSAEPAAAGGAAAPERTWLERRAYPSPISTSYSTEACLLAFPTALPRAAEVPLVAAIRMMLPCLVRAGEGLVDAEFATVGGARCLGLFDRTPGGSGIARHLHHEGLRDLLQLARAALERLVGPEAQRVRALYDTSLEGGWSHREALSVLDAALDRPPAPAADSPAEPCAGYEPGEGNPGDLGRLWIAESGHTSDLVWTRHAWTSAVPIGGAAAGPVHLDVAVERAAVARALRAAADVGEGPEGLAALIAGAERDLAPIAARLAELAGDAYPEAVLGLVAAIPLRARPLAPSERAPLVVLSRRRADAAAKALLACALLRSHGPAALLEGPRGWLVRVAAGEQERVFDVAHAPPRPAAPDEVASARQVLE